MFDVKFTNVSKRYVLGSTALLWRRSALRLAARNQAEIWALRDASFQVEQGEALGIVGHNGAGKSTMLKLLSSITAPTRGEIAIRGRLSALIELGSGFHPELTGRENVYLNGSILGMTDAEITRKIDSILEFAGIGDYIDVPVKKYSSGMYVRLGFSIAAHVDPDILVLDEVLAVGDVAFQAKCLDRIRELREAGRTIVLVTHDLAAIVGLCDRAMLIDGGRIVATGSPRTVIDEYVTMGFGSSGEPAAGRPASGRPAECSSISFVSGDAAPHIRTGYPMIARLTYQASQSFSNVTFKISIYWPSGYLCFELATAADPKLDLHLGAGTVEFCCPVLSLQPGLYRVDVSLESNGYVIDRRQRCSTLHVEAGKMTLGDFYMDYSWRITNN